MNNKRSNFVLTSCFLILLTGCAATKHTVRQASAHRQTGVNVKYYHPRSLVFRVAKEAVQEAGFRITKSGEGEFSFTAKNSGVPLLGVGERLDLYFKDKGHSSTLVTIKSMPSAAANLLANFNETVPKDSSAEIHAYISEKLSSLPPASISSPEPEKVPQEKLASPEKEAPKAGPIKISLAKRWAVIIGVSNYSDSRIPSLRYSTSDAKSFYDWIVSPSGGRYAPANVKLLLDQQATGINIRDALFVWLKQAIEEDMVTIFFAGHGSAESPDSPGNLFLLPFDVQYGNIAATGFPMWDIETALKRFIKAKKVVVIADACHSGGIGQSFDIVRRANRDIHVNPISSGLQNLSKIGDGVCVISASDDNQFSQESHKWGGGHGVFTYFLLKGLKSEADYSKDGKVTLGELIPFLSEQVRRATKNAQSPTVAGKFDPALSIGKEK